MTTLPKTTHPYPLFRSYESSEVFRQPDRVASPPEKLFVRGALEPGLACPRIGIVGSRIACGASRKWAWALAAEAATRGIAVVSGGARGIDAEAHWGALSVGGVTWWVSGTAVDRVYPAEHGPLLRELLRCGGALLSELAPGMKSGRHFFRLRNRLIAGLSDALVVVAAGAKSGTLATIDYALKQRVKVYIPPIGSVPETIGITALRNHAQIQCLSRENLFTQLSKRGGNCIARGRS